MVTWVKVNRHEAWILWDSESTMSELTLSFAHVAGIKVAPLATPMILQLGMIGSHSIVSYSTRVTINVVDEY